MAAVVAVIEHPVVAVGAGKDRERLATLVPEDPATKMVDLLHLTALLPAVVVMAGQGHLPFIKLQHQHMLVAHTTLEEPVDEAAQMAMGEVVVMTEELVDHGPPVVVEVRAAGEAVVHQPVVVVADLVRLVQLGQGAL